MITKTIKEIIIMLIVCLITMLILAIVLYQYIPSKKIIPDIIQYSASETVQDLLEDDIDSRTNQDKIILTYEVTSSDLNNYQTTKEYVPGKSNPFAAYTKTITEEEANGRNMDAKDMSNVEATGTKSSTNSINQYSQNKGTK